MPKTATGKFRTFAVQVLDVAGKLLVIFARKFEIAFVLIYKMDKTPCLPHVHLTPLCYSVDR